MLRTRSGKAMLTTCSVAIYEVVTMICGLILPRILLVAFGSSCNGMVASISKLISFISILRLGVAGSTRVALYRSLAQEDIQKTSGIIVATERYMKKIAVVLVGYIAILAFFYPFIVDSTMSNGQIALLVIIIGFGALAEYLFGITYQTLLRADQRVYIYYFLQTLTTVANTLIAVALIRCGASILVVKFGSAVLFFLTPLVLSIYIKKLYKINKKAPPDNEALNQKKDVMAQSVANIVHENTDITLLTLFASTATISVYSVYTYVTASLNKIMFTFTVGLEAGFGDMFAKRERENIKRNLELYEGVVGVFISTVFSCTILLIIPFVKLYTAGVSDTNYIVSDFAAVTIAAQAVSCFREPYKTMVQAAGKYKETKKGAVIEAGINLCVSIMGVFLWGLVGVAVGTLVANIFRTIQYVIYVSKNLVLRKLVVSLKKFAWIVLNIFIICAIRKLLPVSFEYTSWLVWVEDAALCLLIAAVITAISLFVFYKGILVGILNRISILSNRFIGRKNHGPFHK